MEIVLVGRLELFLTNAMLQTIPHTTTRNVKVSVTKTAMCTWTDSMVCSLFIFNFRLFFVKK